MSEQDAPEPPPEIDREVFTEIRGGQPPEPFDRKPETKNVDRSRASDGEQPRNYSSGDPDDR